MATGGHPCKSKYVVPVYTTVPRTSLVKNDNCAVDLGETLVALSIYEEIEVYGYDIEQIARDIRDGKLTHDQMQLIGLMIQDQFGGEGTVATKVEVRKQKYDDVNTKKQAFAQVGWSRTSQATIDMSGYAVYTWGPYYILICAAPT